MPEPSAESRKAHGIPMCDRRTNPETLLADLQAMRERAEAAEAKVRDLDVKVEIALFQAWSFEAEVHELRAKILRDNELRVAHYSLEAKLMDEKQAGEEPRKMSGSYVYKDGDWTYEELQQHRQDLLDAQRLVWGALGFDQPWMVTPEQVAAKARRLRSPIHWARRLFGFTDA